MDPLLHSVLPDQNTSLSVSGLASRPHGPYRNGWMIQNITTTTRLAVFFTILDLSIGVEKKN